MYVLYHKSISIYSNIKGYQLVVNKIIKDFISTGLFLVSFELLVCFEDLIPFKKLETNTLILLWGDRCQVITNFKTKLIKLSLGCEVDAIVIAEILK